MTFVEPSPPTSTFVELTPANGIVTPVAYVSGWFVSTGSAVVFVPDSGALQPYIDLNFASNQYTVNGSSVSLASLLTLANISNQTVINGAGAVSAAANNLPALSDTGLQTTWEARTNLALQSASLTTAPWTTFANGTGTLSSIANSGVSPDGTTTATQFTIYRSDANASFAEVTQNFAGTAGVYTASIWLKAASTAYVGVWVTLNLYPGSGAVQGSQCVNVLLTNNWVRYSVSTTFGSAATCQFNFGYLAVTNPPAGNPTGGPISFLAWGAQIELQATAGAAGPSPYIPTTTVAVTRGAANITATGALATLLAGSAGTIAVWSNGVDQNSVAKTLVAANGAVLLGVNSSNQATTAVGATLASSIAAVPTAVNNIGFSWDASGGLLDLIGTITQDATARTPSAPFQLFSTGATSNFWNGTIGRIQLWNTKLQAPQCALPSGVMPGFVSRFAGSPLPGAVQFRDLSGLNFAAAPALYLQNSGAYNAAGTNTPYLSSSSKVGSTFYALTEGAIAGQADRQHQWRNINLYTGSNPLTWTPDSNNPAITATIGGLDDNFLLHPAITRDFAGGAAFTMFYGAIDTSNINCRIFRATSPTGVAGSWTKQGVVIDQNSGAGYPNPYLPGLITVGNTVYMYVAPNGDNSRSIVVFTSPTSGDGSVWTFAGTALAVPALTDWDAATQFIIDPFVIKNKHGWYEMGYTAYRGVQILGYAVSDNPLGPFIRYPQTIQAAFHLGQTGDIAMIEDANNFYFLWEEDNGLFPNGTGNPYGTTLPPY